MNFKFTRLLSLVVVMFTMSLPTMASSYYSKVVATAVGDGKVYASTSKTNSPAYEAGSSSATKSGQAESAPTHTYYVYAQANADNEFVGWYDNAQCSGTALSTSSPYEVKVTANSTDENNPTTTTVYAKFRKVGAPVLNYGTSHAYVNISVGTYKNETLTTENVTGTITYESSNENVATVAADGTVTLKKNGSCFITAKFGEVEGSYILTVIDDVAAGVTQIGNGDFENWSNVTSSNHAPNNWNSFETVDGSNSTLIGFAKGQQVSMMEGGRPGSDGFYYADIYSRSIMNFATAQGNLTLGCIYAGNTSAAHADNHNYSNVSNPAQSETISKIPSAIKVWVKFTPVNTSNQARLSATIHDEYNYITYGSASDDTEENKAHAIAQAALNFSACDWTELTIPFEPTGNTTDGQMYIVVNLTTNSVPGKGDVGDHLYIDDIELVYPEVEPVVYDKYICVAFNGVYSDPVAAPIEVTYNEDSTIDFNLKNFTMTLGGTTAYVGNISVPNLAMDEDGNFSFNGIIQITEGDLEGVAANEWLGPSLGNIPVELIGTITDDYFYVHIDINVGYPVEVEVGDLANAMVSVSSALVSTFCAPFTVVIPQQYQQYVSVSTVTDVVGNVLTLEPIANGVIPANTPVIVEAPMAASLPVSGIYVKGTPTVGLLTGVYEDTAAPVGSYVLQNNGKVGFYQVAAGQQPTVGANRCYLTVPAGVKAAAFFFDEDDATGIKAIDNAQQTAEGAAIYNLAGQRMSKMQKGINIINGKKILK
jgi:hypothetical protein